MLPPFTSASHDGDLGCFVRNIILNSIFQKGQFIIPDIASQTGFSVTTIAKYVSELYAEDILEKGDCLKTNKRGRNPVLYRVKSGTYYFLGVDLKPFELIIGLMNLTGDMVCIERITDFRFENTHNKLDEICTHISQFMLKFQSQNAGKIAGVNFNIGGRVNSHLGTSATIFNFEETREVPLTLLLNERLGIPVFIENDTKAMAYGEYVSENNASQENVIYVNIGWGLGLCIIINGEIYYGKDGYSGEFGHIHMYENNVMCHCGKKGCIETEISGSAVCRKLVERIYNHEASVLSKKVRRSMEILRDLERKYGLHPSVKGEEQADKVGLHRVNYREGNVKQQISSVVRSCLRNYKCSSYGEFCTLLELFNVSVEERTGTIDGRNYAGSVSGSDRRRLRHRHAIQVESYRKGCRL